MGCCRRRCMWMRRRPHVDWSAGAVALLTEARPWPARGSAAPGGGVVVRDQRHQRACDRGVGSGRVGAVGARGRPGAGGAVGGVGEIGGGVAGSGRAVGRACACRRRLDVADVGWTLAGRAVFEHRAVVVGGDRERLLAGLDELAGDDLEPCFWGRSRACRDAVGKTVFVFPGQGAQLLGMGGDCTPPTRCSPRRSTPSSANWTGTCCGPLRDVMWGQDENLLNTTEFAAARAVRGGSRACSGCWNRGVCDPIS